MILNLGSLSFNADINGGGGTPAWGTEMGQGDGYKFNFEDVGPLMTGLIYNSIPDINNVTCPLGKGGQQSSDYEFVIASLFKKVYVNGLHVKDAQFLLLVVKKLVGAHHVGRRTLKYNPRMTYNGVEINEDCYRKVESTLGLNKGAAWFINEINIKNQDELHFTAYIMSDHSLGYDDSEKRKQAYLELIRAKSKSAGTSNRNSANKPTAQTIFYGCPGTGKSRKVKDITEGEDGVNIVYFDEKGAKIYDIESYGLNSKVSTNIYRTTFHPDYDYSTFVGSYKPVMTPVLDVNGNETGKEELAYEFVPQVFTNAYVRALKSLADANLTESEKQVYLIIEEINRGNCAQIFGDLFQLLDRKNGRSEYSIIPDAELRKYLAKEGLASNELELPENLHIYATMNTSDQSLFPMDSAFKRRWAMEYVPIDLDQETAKKYTFKISGEDYSWVEFLRKINPLIRKATDSEDKQMGEFFIKDHVTEEEFVNKVMFYLWNDVCKDLYSASRISPLYFMRSAAGEDKKDVFTFAELFGDGRHNEDDGTDTKPKELMVGFITKYLEMKPLDKKQSE